MATPIASGAPTIEDRSLDIKADAVEVGERQGYEYWIVPNCCMRKPEVYDRIMAESTTGHLVWKRGYQAYVVFPSRFVTHQDLLDLVNVHGGLTYSHESVVGQVCGYDTMHSWSAEEPVDEFDYHYQQIDAMIAGVERAAALDPSVCSAKEAFDTVMEKARTDMESLSDGVKEDE